MILKAFVDDAAEAKCACADASVDKQSNRIHAHGNSHVWKASECHRVDVDAEKVRRHAKERCTPRPLALAELQHGMKKRAPVFSLAGMRLYTICSAFLISKCTPTCTPSVCAASASSNMPTCSAVSCRRRAGRHRMMASTLVMPWR